MRNHENKMMHLGMNLDSRSPPQPMQGDSTGRPQATWCVRKEIKSEKWNGPSPLYRPYLNQGSGGPPKGEAFRDIERLAVYNVKLAFGIDVVASWIARAFSKHSSRKQGYRGKSPIPATDLKFLC